jgi:ABC-2 type transport system permease protein
MSKVWLIAQHHYKQEVMKRSFIILMLSLPLFLIFSVGMGMLTERLENKTPTLGYVDEAELLVNMLPGRDDEVRLVSFETSEGARAALDTGSIDAYYVVPSDYVAGGEVEFVFYDQPRWVAIRRFGDLVRVNLLSNQPPEIVERVLPGPRVTVRATAYNREFPGGDPSAGQVVPIAVGVVFTFFTMTISGYLMGVLVTEKENRTMEILVSSVSPGRMMLGKMAAGVGIGLTLLVVWVVFFVAAAWLGRSVLEIAWLQEISLNWRDILIVPIVALPSLLFTAALMTVIATMVSNQQEADQMGPFMFMIGLLPLYLLLAIAKSPNGALAIGISLFPPTSVMAIAFRSLFREIPMWQVAASAGVSLCCGMAMVWLAGKAFRASMLRYGQRLRWSRLLGRGVDRTAASSGLSDA